MKMRLLIALACALPVWADGSQKVGTPVLEGTTVTCLNKQLEYMPELGAIRLTADGETLLTSCVCFHETDRRVSG